MASRTFQTYGYKAGDSLSFSSAYLGQYAGVWNTGSEVRFFIPLSKPILANNVSLTGNLFIRTQGQNRVDASFGGDMLSSSTNIVKMVQGIGVDLYFTENKGIEANTPCVVQISNLKATFS